MLPGVSKTALLTLRARVDEHARPDRVLVDPLAAQWWTKVAWPSELDAWYAASFGLAFRADDIDRIAARYAATSAVETVVELGAGLSTRWARLGPIASRGWVDLDLPEVVALREAWGAGGDGHQHIASSVLDRRWMDALGAGPHLFIAEGLFYYLPRDEVDRLLLDLRARFPGSALILDVLGRADHPKLLEATRAIGSPIAWKHETAYDEVLDDLGLGTIEGFEPARLTDEMLARYWHRFDDQLRGTIYWTRGAPDLWQRKSGVVIGGLGPP